MPALTKRKIWIGTHFATASPNKTAKRVATANASIAPQNIGQGDLVFAVMLKIAISVLSANSATSIVVNAVKNIFQSILRKR